MLTGAITEEYRRVTGRKVTGAYRRVTGVYGRVTGSVPEGYRSLH